MKKLLGIISIIALAFLASCWVDDVTDTVTDTAGSVVDTAWDVVGDATDVVGGAAEVVVDEAGNVSGKIMDLDGDEVADINTTVDEIEDAMEKSIEDEAQE